MIDLSKRQFKIYVQQLLDWLEGKFTAVARSIDFTTVNAKIDTVGGKVDAVSSKIDNIDIDTTDLAKQGSNAAATNTAILAAMPTIPTDYAKQGTNPDATNTAILAAFGNIDFSTLAKQGTNADATLTAILAALQSSEEDTPEELPAGLADRVMLLLQHFGIAGSYEAEAKGGERTNNTVIDECKVRFQDAFNGLLPTGFTMPNSVTVDNLTYTGTTNS